MNQIEQRRLIHVSYIVVGQDDEARMNFISALSIEKKQYKVAKYASITRNIVIKDRQDCKVQAQMIDMPMIQVQKLEAYAPDSKAMILILKAPQTDHNQQRCINIPSQIIYEYCRILYHQIKVCPGQMLKLIICFNRQVHIDGRQEIQQSVYEMIRNMNIEVWKSLTGQQFREIIYDKTSQWMTRNIEKMRTQLKQNNFRLTQSLDYPKLKQRIEKRENQKRRKQEQQLMQSQLEMKIVRKQLPMKKVIKQQADNPFVSPCYCMIQ